MRGFLKSKIFESRRTDIQDLKEHFVEAFAKKSQLKCDSVFLACRARLRTVWETEGAHVEVHDWYRVRSFTFILVLKQFVSFRATEIWHWDFNVLVRKCILEASVIDTLDTDCSLKTNVRWASPLSSTGTAQVPRCVEESCYRKLQWSLVFIKIQFAFRFLLYNHKTIRQVNWSTMQIMD